MSFEGFARDVFESWSDVGVVYTRNKYGRVVSPPGFSIGCKNSNSFKNNVPKGANCSFIIDNNIQNPQSLFLICLDFVAKNICMVESLEGFPDIVGEQLFQKVQENDGFGSDPRNIRIFCEAYGELVLSKLSLSSAHVFTSNYLEYLQLFVCLTELDVSHCRLGDTHELLSYVAHLHNLKSLSLKDNCLSDAGVRHFTLPRRFFKSGLGKLSVLDLSLNPNITDKSVKHIAKLHSLSALNLSGTRISFGHGVPQLIKDTTLCLALDLEEFKQEKTFTVTKGWAVEVISDWKEKSKVCPADVTIDTQLNRKTTKFYKSSRHHLVCRSTPKNKSTSELPKIMLCAKENRMPCCRPSPIQKMATIPGQDGKNNSARNGQPKKRFKTRGTAFSSSVTTEECLEDGVLNNYLKCEKQWKPVKRKCSLLESLDLVS
ncbi:hypothetical protein pdam_00010818 [Pocillopora damicornis]|uniref:Leucine-rich repeat-containing protein 42 n=1 Tax=Pocillopora damicornis TaxID=46731 RepID=A0A3M6UYI6_POCDA|nr:leucine-rich repeat-containing protein 42-like [Pocillopora damicornis]RMX58743.1 hypothetical protein pdam_00010818 [Pocillopora damicornis]